jgi:outer membrane receptor protein involved in Fe transport
VEVGAGVAVRGFVTLDNVFDKRYIASAFLNPDVVAGVPVAFEPGLPRHLVISVGISRN